MRYRSVSIVPVANRAPSAESATDWPDCFLRSAGRGASRCFDGGRTSVGREVSVRTAPQFGQMRTSVVTDRLQDGQVVIRVGGRRFVSLKAIALWTALHSLFRQVQAFQIPFLFV